MTALFRIALVSILRGADTCSLLAAADASELRGSLSHFLIPASRSPFETEYGPSVSATYSTTCRDRFALASSRGGPTNAGRCRTTIRSRLRRYLITRAAKTDLIFLKANNSTATDSLSGNRSIGSGYSGTSLDVVDQTIYHSSSDSESSDVSRHAIRTLVGPALGPRNRNMGEPSRDVSTCKARASEKAAAKMLEGASANISWLLEFSERTPAQIIEERRSRNSDRRIGDIRNVQGQTTAGKEDRLLRSFAQRSLGVDYTCQQRWSRPKTRVDELCESICSSDPEIREHIQRRTNEVKVYVDGLKVSADDRETWQRGINAGVKILVGEELFRRRLEEYGKPMLTDVVAAFTALKGFAFSRLRYEEIPGFIDLILPRNPNDEQASVRVTIEQTEIQCSVADALIALSPWFARFRHTYDGMLPWPASIIDLTLL